MKMVAHDGRLENFFPLKYNTTVADDGGGWVIWSKRFVSSSPQMTTVAAVVQQEMDFIYKVLRKSRPQIIWIVVIFGGIKETGSLKDLHRSILRLWSLSSLPVIDFLQVHLIMDSI
ncbi:hypothetical protein R6Q59_018236 [Mikania micrantha]